MMLILVSMTRPYRAGAAWPLLVKPPGEGKQPPLALNEWVPLLFHHPQQEHLGKLIYKVRAWVSL